MKRVVELAVAAVALVIGLRMLACSLASATPDIAALFAMFVIGRCIWHYTK